MKCVVLAGGSGDSLWPLSRKNYPKQFISSRQKLSVFQETITCNIPFCDEFVIITSQKYEMIVAGQMQQFQGIKSRIILEENGLGTAGAVALLLSLFEDGEELLILPSDLLLAKEGYAEAVGLAKQYLKNDKIVLFGAVPDKAGVQYGYIQYHGSEVTRFIEKPSMELAQQLYQRPDVLWNCGVLICTVSTLSRQMLCYAADLVEKVHSIFENASVTRDGNLLLHVEPEQVKLSFDYAILEHSHQLSVVRMNAAWTDFSEFASYEKMYGMNHENVICEDCKNVSIVNRTEGQLVVMNGLEDTLVINTADALYITDRYKQDNIKKIMREHYDTKAAYFNESPLIYRPWGTRELVQSSERYRVRKLVIYPGMKLSNHVHQNRNENYTVVSGTLTIELEHETIELGQQDSYNILPGCHHRLRNNTDDMVTVIEVDTGEYIDESDMITMMPPQRIPDAPRKELPVLYKLRPAYKDYLWGGNLLKERYGKVSGLDITAESWELSAHPDGSSVIEGGCFHGMSFEQFIRLYGDQTCGWKSKIFDRFPILIKFIDARKALSVQIHPNDDYAFAKENEFGKNEMWYVLDCCPDAYLFCGLKQEVTKEELRERIENETLTEVLNKIPVQPGDVIFVPAGTIHAIGAGILICEIQQNSNCTYRMYDYGRRDKNGKLRELHLNKAMDVVNLEPYYPDTTGVGEKIVYDRSTQRVLSRCKYFQVTKYRIPDHEMIQMDDSSFKSIVVLQGECRITCGEEVIEANSGDSIFVASGRRRVHIEGNCELIVTNI